MSFLKAIYTKMKRRSITKGESPKLLNEEPKHYESDESENPDENPKSSRLCMKQDEKKPVQRFRRPITRNANKSRIK